MKSQLITTLLDDPEGASTRRFKGHLDAILALAPADIDKMLAAFPDILFAETQGQQRRIIEDLATKCEAGLDVLVRSSSILQFFVKASLRQDLPEKEISLWVPDMIECGVLSADKEQAASAILKRLAEDVVPSIEPRARRLSAASGVLPVFARGGYTVEVRSVPEDIYRRGNPIGEYVPKILDAAAVVSLHLMVDSGTPADFYFQATAEDVDYLVDLLKAARKELAAFEEYLGLANQGEGGER